LKSESVAHQELEQDQCEKPVSAFRALFQALPACHSNTQRQESSMGLFSKDIKTMDDLFVHQLQDIYYAEKAIYKSLPKMIAKATDPALKLGLETHRRETEGHIARLEQVFKQHGAEAKAVNCPAIDGIIEEAEDLTGEVENKPVLDAAIIAAAQAVEHYEITRYGTLTAWAKQLGRKDCAALLQQNLDEEFTADGKLSMLAERGVNRRAAA
jgi:ferritin-like metal-binding protein YciE